MTVTVVGLVAGTSALFILQVYLSTWTKRKDGVASVTWRRASSGSAAAIGNRPTALGPPHHHDSKSWPYVPTSTTRSSANYSAPPFRSGYGAR